MKKIRNIVFILIFSLTIFPKVGSLRKLPKPSISPSSSIIPTATPSGVMSNAPFLL